MNPALPDGWTIERIRALSGVPRAAALSVDRLVVLEEPGKPDYLRLWPDVILVFGELCLARAGGDWHLGDIGSDGSIICWSAHGPDLAEAIRAL